MSSLSAKPCPQLAWRQFWRCCLPMTRFECWHNFVTTPHLQHGTWNLPANKKMRNYISKNWNQWKCKQLCATKRAVFYNIVLYDHLLILAADLKASARVSARIPFEIFLLKVAKKLLRNFLLKVFPQKSFYCLTLLYKRLIPNLLYFFSD